MKLLLKIRLGRAATLALTHHQTTSSHAVNKTVCFPQPHATATFDRCTANRRFTRVFQGNFFPFLSQFWYLSRLSFLQHSDKKNSTFQGERLRLVSICVDDGADCTTRNPIIVRVESKSPFCTAADQQRFESVPILI